MSWNDCPLCKLPTRLIRDFHTWKGFYTGSCIECRNGCYSAVLIEGVINTDSLVFSGMVSIRSMNRTKVYIKGKLIKQYDRALSLEEIKKLLVMS